MCLSEPAVCVFVTLQFVLAIVFVALYVLATYSPPAPGSPRYKADIFLCALFAGEYVHRMLVRRCCDVLRCAALGYATGLRIPLRALLAVKYACCCAGNCWCPTYTDPHAAAPRRLDPAAAQLAPPLSTPDPYHVYQTDRRVQAAHADLGLERV